MEKLIVGRDIGNYVFDASAKTITFSGIPNFAVQDLDIITNQTDGILIYNFASTPLGGVLSGNVLTLTYDTTTMSDTDELQIRISKNIRTDVNLGVNKNIPQAFAPVQTNDSEPLVSPATLIASAPVTWTDQSTTGTDVTAAEFISYLITHTHSTSTGVSFRLQCSDAIDGTYYTPVDTAYTVAVGDVTGTKAIKFNVAHMKYVKLQGYVATLPTDTVTIKLLKTLNS